MKQVDRSRAVSLVVERNVEIFQWHVVFFPEEGDHETSPEGKWLSALEGQGRS